MLMSFIYTTLTTPSKTPITTTLVSSNGTDTIQTTILHPLTLSLLTSTTSTYVSSSTSGLTEPTNPTTGEFIRVRYYVSNLQENINFVLQLL